MIYTFGRTSNYDKDLSARDDVKKIGRQEDYAGGSVWRTYEEAQAFVDSLPNEFCPDWYAKDFSVYGVIAEWETETYQGDEGAPWRNLRKDSLLVKLKDPK